MNKFKLGEKVQLLKVDYAYNNAYGTIVDIQNGDTPLTVTRYRIHFEGPVTTNDWFPESVIIVDRRDFAQKLGLSGNKPTKDMLLSTDPTERKGMPITTGVLDYFPLAIAAVAQCSKAGNDQHNPGQPLHWSREKSTDHHDCIARHLIDRGSLDTDGIRHSAKLAWRALAALQLELEAEGK